MRSTVQKTEEVLLIPPESISFFIVLLEKLRLRRRDTLLLRFVIFIYYIEC